MSAAPAIRSPGHPENPERITRTLARLRSQNELPIEWANPGRANDEQILRAHAPELLARLQIPRDFDADTPFYENIAGYARASAAAALDALKTACKGEHVFSLMRPPGHHATHDQAMGFCYLNNIAIAALDALAIGPRRVAVFDFDVHHGNGTEDILLEPARHRVFFRPSASLLSGHRRSPCRQQLLQLSGRTGRAAGNVSRRACLRARRPEKLPARPHRRVRRV